MTMSDEELLKAALADQCPGMDWPVDETKDIRFKDAREVLRLMEQARQAGFEEGKAEQREKDSELCKSLKGHEVPGMTNREMDTLLYFNDGCDDCAEAIRQQAEGEGKE